jgi:hypothetical protein
MQARTSVLTLGVAELERSLAFYRDGLKLSTQGSSAGNSSMAPWRFSISRAA